MPLLRLRRGSGTDGLEGAALGQAGGVAIGYVLCAGAASPVVILYDLLVVKSRGPVVSCVRLQMGDIY